MPDHLHVITDSTLQPSKTLQFINGITSRRIIDYLKEHKYESSLAKLRHETRQRSYTHSLWDHHPNVRLLWSEKMLMERVNYTHQNPARAGIVNYPAEYRWSSVRCWNREVLEDEPLLMNIDRISWSVQRKAGGFPHCAAAKPRLEFRITFSTRRAKLIALARSLETRYSLFIKQYNLDLKFSRRSL